MYKNLKIKIPLDKRAYYNEQILKIVDGSDSKGVTNEEIYNGWSAKGGVHGLNKSDFRNFHKYSEAKKEYEEGQFFTPDSICSEMVEILQVSNSDLVADLTCGKGSFINALPSEANVYGCDIDRETMRVARFLFPDAKLETNSIEYYDPPVMFDVVVGNPPFNLKIGGYVSQLFYFIKSNEVMKEGAMLSVVVPESFLKDAFFNKKMIEIIDRSFNFICQYKLTKSAFEADIETKVMFFQKKGEGLVRSKFVSEYVSKEVAGKTISELREVQRKVMAKLALRSGMRNPNNFSMKQQTQQFIGTEYEQKEIKEGRIVHGFEFMVKKYIYEIKHQKLLKKRYKKALAYLTRFRNQKMPEFSSDEARKEFMKNKWITQGRVIGYLKKAIKVPNGKVRKNESLSLQKVRRAEKVYDINEKQISEMGQSLEVSKFLSDFELHERRTGKTIRLNPRQLVDVNIAVQKRIMMIQWSMGAGKSIAGLALADHRLMNVNIRNVIIVGPSIAIKNTWNVILDAYGKNYICINKPSQFANIKGGQIITMTMHSINKCKKQLKNYLKSIGNKIQFILDESDTITNTRSQRTKVILDCFQKSRYKLLLSGTMTRNNIVEAFSQFYLMFGGTDNFVSDVEEIFVYDAEDENVIGLTNHQFGCRFPAYKAGEKLFKASFNPDKTTVFGISQQNQDVRNSSSLRRLMGKSLITRTFEEIVGRKIFEIEQIQCKMTLAEEELNGKVMNEFYSMRDNYFSPTGDSRKDAMFKILQQMRLMLKVCAVPQALREYTGGIPEKFRQVGELIKQNSGFLAIGVKHIKTVEYYETYITKNFPERKLFVSHSKNSSIEQRQAIVREMEKHKGSILLCTQGSFSSSMNINFVDTVIIPELDWNDSKMSQFYFRFIRYDSVRDKKVIFVTYSRSIEANVLKMVLCKEKLNLFMKDKQVSDKEIYEMYGIQDAMMANLMSRGTDEYGQSYFKWGEQLIS